MADIVYVREFYPAGKLIFAEGRPGNEMYIVESGNVEIWKTINNDKKVLATLHKGQVFGEMALIDTSVRMASAEAAPGGTTLIKISASKVEEALSQCPPIIRTIMKALVENLRRVQ